MNESLKEKTLLAVTAGRIVQAADLYRRVTKGSPVRAATAAIIGVDLGDGIAARKLGVDGPKRRALDSTIDSAIIATGLYATYKKHPKARPYVGALAVRELFVAGGWAADLIKSKQVKKGDDWHKLPSLSIAAFCVAAHHGSERVMKTTGIAAIGVNAMLAYDYYKGWNDPARRRILDTGVEEVAGFHDAKTAAQRFMSRLPQLEAPLENPQLPEGARLPYDIESTCEEITE